MRFKLVTFDVYSALVDINLSLSRALRRVVSETELADNIAQTWRRRQWDYLLIRNSMGKHVSYDYATRCALDYTLDLFKTELTAEEKEMCMREWTTLSLWPEGFDVLTELKRRGYKIALLSNGDENMLRDLAVHFAIDFDDIFASSQANAYKPNPAIYQLPYDRWNLSREEVLHVAGSSIDMMGAKSCGVVCAWTNRFQNAPIDQSFKPDFEYTDLNGLLELLV